MSPGILFDHLCYAFSFYKFSKIRHEKVVIGCSAYEQSGRCFTRSGTSVKEDLVYNYHYENRD